MVPFLAEAGAAEPAGLGAGHQLLGIGAGHGLAEHLMQLKYGSVSNYSNSSLALALGMALQSTSCS
jgi:hypothetical protein